jgi:hypothetical protein
MHEFLSSRTDASAEAGFAVESLGKSRRFSLQQGQLYGLDPLPVLRADCQLTPMRFPNAKDRRLSLR